MKSSARFEPIETGMPPLTFNSLLEDRGLNEDTVLLRNTEPCLRGALPYIASERPDLFCAYQQVQGVQLGKALGRAKVMASFVGEDSADALFVTCFAISNVRPITFQEFWSEPENQELASFGYLGVQEGSVATRCTLTPTNALREFSGRLVASWPPPAVSWWRWADRNIFPIVALYREPFPHRQVPDWKEMVLDWATLTSLPRSWEAALSQWRGIYFIYDARRKAGYVGSAYGKDNILGRWRTYAASGHGGNAGLRDSKAEDLLFSILQRTSPDLEADEIVQLESTWKERLHTRRHGLNRN